MKVRIKFSKKGVMKYIGHLDLQRYFQKAIRRAGIDIAYSSGYSPHQIMSFASPLGVGLESEGEYFDIELLSATSMEVIVSRLDATMAEGMKVINAVVLPDNVKNAMASIEAANYFVTTSNKELSSLFTKDKIDEFLSQDEIIVSKESKKSTRELDIKPLIYSITAVEGGVNMLVCASSAGNIKPQLVVDAIASKNDMLVGEFDLGITRIDLYSMTETGQLRSLGDIE